MYRVIFMQTVATLVAVIGSSLYFGSHGGGSAAIGGLVCVIPNLLFALRIKMVAGRRGASFQVNFILGELFKLLLTVGLLVVIARGYPGVHWPSLLIGLALASQAVFLAFWKKN